MPLGAIIDVAAEKLLRAAKNADKALITGVEVFDVFEGKGVGEGKKSVGIAVTLQPLDKTLTDEEIDKVAIWAEAVAKSAGVPMVLPGPLVA